MTMLGYNKLITAIVSVVLMRWVTRWTGLDLAEIDDDGELKAAIALSIDCAVASVTGFMVWWIPNVRKRLRDAWSDIKGWFA